MKAILSCKSINPRFCLEDLRWFFGKGKEEYYAFPMSCFCDIPLTRLNDHTNFYGNYGIGLTKEWGVRNGLHPVIYCPPESNIQKAVYDMLNFDPKGHNESDTYYMNFFRLLSLIKPISGTMNIKGKIESKEFYQENEWRYVPPSHKYLNQVEFEDKRDKFNSEMESFGLLFEPSDIRYIFVEKDSDIPELFDFLSIEMGGFSMKEVKILQSRITSLETLRIDL
nr:abortive infection system antitoxin AbiGi family protein [Vibrio sp. bablab_jr001]